MKITIHRGTNQIGGCVTEYEHDSWRLFVDYGEQLPGAPKSDKPLEIEGLTKGDLSKSALLITHYHGDHIGKIPELDENLPIYIGKISRDIIEHFADHMKKVDDVSDALLKRLPTMKTFSSGEQFAIGPFSIMPIVVDHSAFDAYAFKIEADDVNVFHTGDFRTHGIIGDKLKEAVEQFVGHVDYVVCEATNVKRPDVTSISELKLKQKFTAAFKDNKYNIVYLSSTNIDRLFSLYHAAKEAGRKFLVNGYQKEMMEIVARRESFWGETSFYRFDDEEYERPIKLDYFRGDFFVTKKFKYLLEDKGYVLIARANPRFDRLIDKLPGEKKRYLSMWSGYLKPGTPAFNQSLATSVGEDYEYMHTSGHCDMQSLEGLIDMLHPKAIIPIHTDDNAAFAELFADKWPIVLLKDGESINPISTKYIDSIHADLFAVASPADGLSEISNDGNYKWWSLCERRLGDFRKTEDALLMFQRTSFAPNRLLGYSIEEEEDMYPWHEDVFDSHFKLLSQFKVDGHLPGEEHFQEMGRLKPGDKILAVVYDGLDVVVPCEVVGPITEQFMKEEIESNLIGPDYDDIKDTLYDWDWDRIIVRPLVRLKNESEEMKEEMSVQRIYCFPYQEFEI